MRGNGSSSSTIFSQKKFWIGLGIVLSILILVTGRGMFLGIRSSGLDLLAHPSDLLQDNKQSLNDVGELKQSSSEIPESVNNGNDLQFGPIRLDNSAYVRDQLDSFVEEQADGESQESEKPESSGSFSIQDAISNPIKYFEGFGYAAKQSFINNNRKTTLIKLIDSVSRYYISYSKFPDLELGQDYGDYAWIQKMVDANEMSGVYQYLIKTVDPVAYCGTIQQTGYCYSTNEQDAIIYVRLEKPFESDVCGMDGGFFLLWSSVDNKFGNVCLSEEPIGYGGFEFFILQ